MLQLYEMERSLLQFDHQSTLFVTQIFLAYIGHFAIWHQIFRLFRLFID